MIIIIATYDQINKNIWSFLASNPWYDCSAVIALRHLYEVRIEFALMGLQCSFDTII